MDKITKIKRLIRSSLDIYCGQQLTITDLIVLPTFKFDDTCDEWVVDSHAIFLTLQDNRPNIDISSEDYLGELSITSYLETLLNLDVCVEFFPIR